MTDVTICRTDGQSDIDAAGQRSPEQSVEGYRHAAAARCGAVLSVDTQLETNIDTNKCEKNVSKKQDTGEISRSLGVVFRS